MKDFDFVARFPMHWGEMDAWGHANNVHYFRWFESSRVAFFGDMGELLERGVGPVLASTSAQYLRPIVHPAELLVGTRLVRFGRSSMALAHGVARAEAPDVLCATGESVVVFVRFASGKPVRVPDEIRRALESRLGRPLEEQDR